MRIKRLKENKDFYVRYERYRSEYMLLILRLAIQNQKLLPEFRIFSRFNIFKLTSKSRFTGNFKNRCLLTGRIRSTLPYFKLSRMEFRRLAKLNFLSGVRKSSWLVVGLIRSVDIWFKSDLDFVLFKLGQCFL